MKSCRRLKKTTKKIGEAAVDIAKAMCPFDATDNDVMMLEDRAERLQQQTLNISKKL